MLEDYDVQEMLAQFDDEFVDLTDRMNYDKFVDYKRKLCSRNDRMYGIPFDSGTAALFYRVDLLEQAGYTEEDMQNLTWSRYMEIGQKVYEKTGVPMLTLDPTDLPLVRIIMQSCGRWYVAQDGVTADIQQNEALRQALDIYTELLKKNLGMSVNGWNEFISAFQNGEVASVISGGWVLSSIKENQEQSGLWRVTRIPLVENNQDAVPASNVGGSAWYILKNSAHAAVAADFMTEMFAEDTDFMNTLVEQIGIVPSLKDLSVLESYRNTDDFFGGQSVTRLLNSFASVVPTV
jgi:lactose/L-arabinose transport system substrate-binding protein